MKRERKGGGGKRRREKNGTWRKSVVVRRERGSSVGGGEVYEMIQGKGGRGLSSREESIDDKAISCLSGVSGG